MAMQSGLSGYTEAIGSGFMKGRFRWVEKYDVETNTSDITIYPQFKSTNWYGYSYYFSGSYDIDGAAVASMTSSSGKNGIYVSAQNTWLAPSVGATSFTKTGIAHNADGSRSVTLRFNNVRGYNSKSAGGSGWTVSGSVTITLTNIPRGSTVSATDAAVGAVSTLVVNRSVPGAVHSIQYALGALAGYVTEAGGVSATEVRFSDTTVNWTVPTAFFAQMPNTSSAKCTLTIRTYQSGGSQIGEAKSAAMTVTTTQAQSGPTVSGTVTDVNEATVALTGSSAKLVKGHSTARAAITAAARNSASIRSRTVNGTALGAGGYVDYAGNTAASFVFAVTDSRGFSASATVKPQVVDYVPLSLAGSCTRPAPTADTATLALSGNFFNASFGAVDNAISVRYKVDSGEDVPVEVTLSGNTWSASVPLSDMPYTNGYTITVTAADKLTSLTRTIALNPGVPVFDWGKNDFRVNVPLTAAGGVTGDVKGNVTGNVKGNVTGDLNGNVTGNVKGNVTGNLTGNASTATSAATMTLTHGGNKSSYDFTKVGIPLCVFNAAAWNGVDTPVNWEHVPVGFCYMGSAESAKVTKAPNSDAFLINLYYMNQAGGVRGGDHIQVWFALPSAGTYVRYGSGTAWSAWVKL